MKIVEINGTNYSSTGNIMNNITIEARNNGFEVFTCCKKSKKSEEFKNNNQIFIGSRYERIISELLAYVTGYQNSFNYFGTKAFIKKLKKIKPDLLHLHIMHDTYINLELLFKYIKEEKIPVVWTFHDCWAFTGRCPYFDMVNCDKWITGCHNCEQLDKYPATKSDKSKYLWNKKKRLFSNIENMTIVTPSLWLNNLVAKSFMANYNRRVINNGIDLDKFKQKESSFKKKNHLNDKKIILGISFNWTERKGLNDFIELSKRLSDEYQIVLVGTNDEIDKRIPSNIMSIHKTYNQDELIDIYNSADVFVNPTKEENFPTVNIEALACGTPVITYQTGGSVEIIDNSCGSIVEKGNVDALYKEIIRVCKEKVYSTEDCIERAKNFDCKKKYNEYVELYKEILVK